MQSVIRFILRFLKVLFVFVLCHGQPQLMFRIPRFGLMPGCDSIFASNFAVPAHRGKFTSALMFKIVARGLFRLPLGVMNRGCAVGVIALVHPFSISLEY